MIDLHVHSTFSDGTDTPEIIVKKADKAGIRAIALTDHDCIQGNSYAINTAKNLNIDFLPGVEFSVYNGPHRTVHILGINLDIDSPDFREQYCAYRDRRASLITPIFDHLQSKGIPITKEKVMTYTTENRLDRQSVCKWLLANNYVETMLSAWVHMLDPIPYKKEDLCSMEEAIHMIHTAGGKAFLAHYTKYIGLEGYSREERLKFLKNAKELGLDGIELYYPTFTKEDKKEAAQYMDSLSLIACGGTDYHGLNRKGIDLGIGGGDFSVPDQLLDNFYI